MSENDTELQNSQESDTESQGETEETLTAEELQEKNRQLYARLKKAEEENKTLKSERKPDAESEHQATQIPNESVERLTLKVDGYADEEISEIMSLGGLKALKNPIVKKAIDAMREERLAEQAQVTESGATSDISRKYSPEDLRKMSAKELEQILPRS